MDRNNYYGAESASYNLNQVRRHRHTATTLIYASSYASCSSSGAAAAQLATMRVCKRGLHASAAFASLEAVAHAPGCQSGAANISQPSSSAAES